MKKIISSTILILLLNQVHSQNPLVKQWDNRFGGTDFDEIFCFQQTKDGGYILGGFSESGIGGDKTQTTWGYQDYWIVKIDSLGNKQWDKDFGGTGDDEIHSIQQTIDGGSILGGWSNSGISGDKTQNTWGDFDFWIIKIDSLGNKQWDKDFGGIGQEWLFSVYQTSDKGYILGGFSVSNISGDKTQNTWGGADYWIVKTDSLGIKQWDKDFGGIGDDAVHSAAQTSDGGFILGGLSSSGISGDKTQPSWGSHDYWIVKTDSFGNKLWDKDFGGNDMDYLFSLQVTADKGFILGGISESDISGDKTQPNWDPGGITNDFWIVKTDSLGNKQWDKDFGGTQEEDAIGNISQTTDGGYLVAGTSYSPISGNKSENNIGSEQTWLMKTDSIGIKQWDKTIFTTGHDEQGLAIQTKDGCYAIANFTDANIGGYKSQACWGNPDYWIIKFCDTTSTTSIKQISNSKFPVSIYPNPTNTLLNFFIATNEHIIITNVLGEIVLQKNAEGKVELDVSFLSAGIYFIKVGNEVRKFVKE
jgi:type IX secretion system substrate protein